ncbi:MAG: VaFE repeat-containing surface-anchored protein, partial [Culicoidibacterales bacterium]
ASNGATVTDVNGNPKTSFSAGEAFKIKVAGSYIGNVNVTVKTKQARYGNIVFKANVAGTQTLAQIKAKDPIEVNASLNLNFTGSYRDVEITKENEDGTKLSGATFEVAKNPEFTNSSFHTSDSNGKIFLDDMLLPNEKLWVREKTAPVYSETDGYNPDPTIYVVDGKDMLNTITIKNKKIVGNLELIKVDDLDRPMSGVIFHLEKASGGRIATATTNSDGKLKFVDIPLGQYFLAEETPDGYEPLEKYPVSIVADSTLVETGKNSNPIYTPVIQVAIRNQEIRMPLITDTVASLADDTKVLPVNENVRVFDTVSYEGLSPKQEYVLIGKLMDKETGQPLLIDGKEVTTRKVFRPEGYETAGRETVYFEFNTAGLDGKEIVVFEWLYTSTARHADMLIAEHADINDEGQTVRVHNPEMSTLALLGDGTKVLPNYLR